MFMSYYIRTHEFSSMSFTSLGSFPWLQSWTTLTTYKRKRYTRRRQITTNTVTSNLILILFLISWLNYRNVAQSLQFLEFSFDTYFFENRKSSFLELGKHQLTIYCDFKWSYLKENGMLIIWNTIGTIMYHQILGKLSAEFYFHVDLRNNCSSNSFILQKTLGVRE